MPRRKKSANEMTDREILEKAFSKRVRKAVDREIGLDEDDNADDTGSTPTNEESS